VALERVAHARPVEPSVVIAEHREDPERRGQALELRRDHVGRREVPARDAVDHVVAREQHEIGPRALRQRDDPRELLGSVERRPDVEVGEHRDAQAVAARGPAGQREFVVLVAQARGLDREAPDERRRDRDHGGEQRELD
jgi:hypothetical protein